ncbi:hypothetical protein C461_04747 [Halorubrum aidingense JCM 13560]|uniref:Uncharacterized protein n=1 Tax=Halorubrum aidingense JCM 13560 TaxID=1230454 RepID=M0PJI3_9EURY|nr:hypothetical protein [Halorubrum aidingense]EMA68910.1 hypothetical protein C461_04747 [Halorubrum aidingense JCM 13560]
MPDPLIIGVLGDYFRESVVIGLLGVIVVLRFRRYRAAGAAAVGALSSAATVAVAVVVTLFGLVALGYWDPPVSEIVGDVLGAGRTVYDTVGEWLIEKLVGWLESVAGNTS